MEYSKHTTKLDIDLISYGSPRYESDLFNPVKTNKSMPIGSKPESNTGLWCSPVDSAYGWYEWCLDNDFELERLNKSFKIRFYGNAIVINCLDDLAKLPWVNIDLAEDKSDPYNIVAIDFDRLQNGRAGIDAIYLTIAGLKAVRFSYSLSDKHLYGWDCESVLIINPDCCQPIAG